MLRAYACLCVMFCSAATFAAPYYRAGQANPSPLQRFLHGEVSASYQFTTGYLQDYLEQTSSDRLHAVGVRALLSPLPWLSAGVDYTRSSKENIPAAWVSSYQETHLGAVVKVTLSPDTNPRFYLLGGYGRSTQRLHFSKFFAPATKKQPYWMLGLGMECDIYRALFLAAEGNIYWHNTQYLHSYYKLSSHATGAVQLRLGVRF